MTKDEIIQSISESLYNFGIVNPFTQAAILAIVSKESAFNLGTGENMNYTSTARLRFVFPSYFKTDADAQPYVNNPTALANKVYGGKYGNTSPGDGWKYRGRGWNGITFKSAYEKFGKMIGADLVNNPDLLNEVSYASDALAAYFKSQFENSGGRMKEAGHADANDFTDLDSAVHMAMRANDGWKKSDKPNNIFIEGEKRAKENAPELYNKIIQLDTTANSPEDVATVTQPTTQPKKAKRNKIKNWFTREYRRLIKA